MVASAVQQGITVVGQRAGVQVGSSGAGMVAVTGENESVTRSLTGEAGGFECFLGVVEEEQGIAVGRCGAGLEAVVADWDDDDGDDEGGGKDEDGGVAVVERHGGAVTSSPSCDPWMSQGC